MLDGKDSKQRALLGLSWLTLFSIGTYHGYRIGFPDLKVFLFAGQLIRGNQIFDLYFNSPDRFLYAPGFAWLAAWLLVFGSSAAIIAFQAIKFGLFALVLQRLSKRFGVLPVLLSLGAVARPLLIDLRYGNINLILLSLTLLAAIDSLEWRKSRGAWAYLWGVFSGAKLLTIPFAGVYLFRRDYRSLFLSVLGILSIWCLPFMLLSVMGGGSLSIQWSEALRSKGLPLETHNQSVFAFLARVFTETPIPSLILGGREKVWGLFGFELETMKRVFLGYVWVWLVVAFALLFRTARARAWEATFLLASILPLASHLVWKPYFLFLFPLAILVFRDERSRVPGLIGAVALNFASSVFLPPLGSAYFEAYCGFIWIQAFWMILVWRGLSSFSPRAPSH